MTGAGPPRCGDFPCPSPMSATRCIFATPCSHSMATPRYTSQTDSIGRTTPRRWPSPTRTKRRHSGRFCHRRACGRLLPAKDWSPWGQDSYRPPRLRESGSSIRRYPLRESMAPSAGQGPRPRPSTRLSGLDWPRKRGQRSTRRWRRRHNAEAASPNAGMPRFSSCASAVRSGATILPFGNWPGRGRTGSSICTDGYSFDSSSNSIRGRGSSMSGYAGTSQRRRIGKQCQSTYTEEKINVIQPASANRCRKTI